MLNQLPNRSILLTLSCLTVCLLLAGCQTEIPDTPYVDPNFSAKPNVVLKAQLLQPSPEGDLVAAKEAPAEDAVEESAGTNSAEPSDITALLERWSQPDPPLQLAKISGGRFGGMPSRVEFTADGQLLYLARYEDARHLLFQTSDGKKVLDVQYGDAPLSCSHITPDGKYLLAPRGEKGTGVWEIAASKEVFLHDKLIDATTLLATAGTAPKIVAALNSGTVSVYPLLGGKGDSWERPKELPPPHSPHMQVQLAVTADGSKVYAFDPMQSGKVIWYFIDAEGKSTSIPIKVAAVAPLAAGNEVFADTLTPGDFMLSRLLPPTGLRYRRLKVLSQGSRLASVSPDDKHAGLLRFDKNQLQIFSCRTSLSKNVLLTGAPPSRAAINWPARLLVTASHLGEVKLYRFSGHTFAADEMSAEVERCLANKDDERIEQFAAALELDPNNFPFDAVTSTKYQRFANLVEGHSNLTAGEPFQQHAKEWLQRNPESSMGRISRARTLISQGWDARGSGYADTVTPEGWRIFHQKNAEARVILERFREEKTIPGEAYSLIFSVAKAESWPEEEIEYYVKRLFDESPRYMPAHCARISDLMPRWGGGPNDCRIYAERVAAKIGGADGDAAYARLVTSLMNYGNHGLIDELGFDAPRFLAGLDHLYRDDSDNADYWQLGMMLAAIAGDGERAKMFAKKITGRGDAYSGLYCNEGIFEDLLRSALNYQPQL